MKKKAFSIVEVSVIILAISIIVSIIVKSTSMIQETKIANAHNITKKSPIAQMNNVLLWYETTTNESFISNITADSLVSDWIVNEFFANYQINLSQPTEATKPQYVAQGIHKVPSLKFNNSCLAHQSGENIILDGKRYTVYMVFQTNSNSQQTLLHIKKASVGSAIYVEINNNNLSFTNRQIVAGSGGQSYSLNIAQNVSYLFRAIKNNDKISIWLNNNNPIANQAISSSSFTATDLSVEIGALGCSARFFNGFISELVIFNKALNENNRKLVDQYLGKKYGISFK